LCRVIFVWIKENCHNPILQIRNSSHFVSNTRLVTPLCFHYSNSRDQMVQFGTKSSLQRFLRTLLPHLRHHLAGLLHQRRLQGVNFINVLHAHFSYKILAPKITKLKHSLCYFWRQNFGKKCAHKMLMKLTQALQQPIVE